MSAIHLMAVPGRNCGPGHKRRLVVFRNINAHASRNKARSNFCKRKLILQLLKNAYK